MRFAHTNLVARDAERLVRFYVAVFDCEVASRRRLTEPWLAAGTGVPGAALVGAHLRLPGHGDAGPTLEIFEYLEPKPPPPAEPPSADRPGFGHIAFEVNDVAAARERVIAQGGEALGEIVTGRVASVGRLTFTYVRDPEGHIIELQRWEPGGGDRER